MIFSPHPSPSLTKLKTCRDLHSIVSNVPSLQYTVALTAYGLVDNELSAKPILEKLERARLTYRAHRDFSWIPHHVIQLENQYIEQPTSPLVLRDATNTTAISLLLSGSIVRDAPDRDWTVHPQPTTAFSRSFNASEDLLVLQTQNAPRCVATLTFRCVTELDHAASSSFHLRTMSDGGAHPEAVLPSLAGGALGVGHLTFGPYLLASGANGVHSLWNWKMGVILTVRPSSVLDVQYILLYSPARPPSRRYAAITPQSPSWMQTISRLYVCPTSGNPSISIVYPSPSLMLPRKSCTRHTMHSVSQHSLLWLCLWHVL